ncbi:MAG: tRNA (adenosine(37)-N6)-threonylcarbamoyltransferase complex ATPase subunit type 1 TsaE [Thermodesulfobacteriota bacterium]
MDDEVSWTIISRGERQTIGIGRTLGRMLEPGSIVALRGELGSGKTRFTQGIAAGLGVSSSDHVSSPSFALIHEYVGRIELYHMDFYRLSVDRGDLELGIEEYLWGEGACVIEWADRVPSILPDDRLDVELAIRSARTREIRFRAGGKRHRLILERFKRAVCETGVSKP